MHNQALNYPKPNKNPLQVAEPDEKIYLLLRRHIVTNTAWVLTAAGLAVLTPFYLFFQPVLSGLHPLFSLPKLLSSQLNWMLVLTYYLGIFLFVLERFLNWYYTVFLITSQRVLDMDLVGFLYKNVTEARLSQIQDVAHSQGGIWQIVFNYGNVFVQTAGTAQGIEMLKVPRPAQVHDFLTDLAQGKKR